jgi:hypothetical protein
MVDRRIMILEEMTCDGTVWKRGSTCSIPWGPQTIHVDYRSGTGTAGP